MLDLVRDASVIGASTLLTAYTLQGLYKVTGYTPPNAVFYFFTGFSGYLALEAVEHLIGKELLIEATGKASHKLPKS